MQDISITLERAKQECLNLIADDVSFVDGVKPSLTLTLSRITSLVEIAFKQIHINEDDELHAPLTEIEARPFVRKNYTSRGEYLMDLMSQAKSTAKTGTLAADMVDRHGLLFEHQRKETMQTIESSCWSAMELIEIAQHIVETAEKETQAVAA